MTYKTNLRTSSWLTWLDLPVRFGFQKIAKMYLPKNSSVLPKYQALPYMTQNWTSPKPKEKYKVRT